MSTVSTFYGLTQTCSSILNTLFTSWTYWLC